MIPYCILIIEDDDDREFMADLYLKYQRLMYREIYKILHDSWATEDVLQSTLEKLIEKVKELRVKDRDHLVNYIIASARNRAKNHLRDHGRHIEVPFNEQIDIADPSYDGSAMDSYLIRESDLQRLKHIWSQLDERNRYVLECRYLLNRTMQEMAQDLGVKPDSVRMILSRARKCAYQLLTQDAEPKA